MLKTHSVRASQTCLHTDRQTYRQTKQTNILSKSSEDDSPVKTDTRGRGTYLQSSQEDSQVITTLYIAHYRSDFYKKYMYIIVVIHRIHFFNRICVIMHFKEKSILTGRVLVHSV